MEPSNVSELDLDFYNSTISGWVSLKFCKILMLKQWTLFISDIQLHGELASHPLDSCWPLWVSYWTSSSSFQYWNVRGHDISMMFLFQGGFCKRDVYPIEIINSYPLSHSKHMRGKFIHERFAASRFHEVHRSNLGEYSALVVRHVIFWIWKTRSCTYVVDRYDYKYVSVQFDWKKLKNFVRVSHNRILCC